LILNFLSPNFVIAAIFVSFDFTNVYATVIVCLFKRIHAPISMLSRTAGAVALNCTGHLKRRSGKPGGDCSQYGKSVIFWIDDVDGHCVISLFALLHLCIMYISFSEIHRSQCGS